VDRREAGEYFREAGFAPQNAILGDLALENADQAAAAGAASAAFRAHGFGGRLGGSQDAMALDDEGGAAGGRELDSVRHLWRGQVCLMPHTFERRVALCYFLRWGNDLGLPQTARG
jgi:hypothetical protein